MEFSVEQRNRIMALRIIGISYKMIRIRFDCKLRDIKQIVKEYPIDMTEQEAINILLN